LIPLHCHILGSEVLYSASAWQVLAFLSYLITINRKSKCIAKLSVYAAVAMCPFLQKLFICGDTVFLYGMKIQKIMSYS
jgi:hypothetical protein